MDDDKTRWLMLRIDANLKDVCHSIYCLLDSLDDMNHGFASDEARARVLEAVPLAVIEEE